MGTVVYSSLWVMRDEYHQPYLRVLCNLLEAAFGNHLKPETQIIPDPKSKSPKLSIFLGFGIDCLPFVSIAVPLRA